MNRQKIPVLTSFFLSVACLFAVSGSSAHAQVAPSSAKSSIQAMADEVAKKMPSRKQLKVVVLDFSPPNKRSAPFGAYLADEFSAALSKEGGTLNVVDRTQLAAALSSLRLQMDDELNYLNNKRIATKVGVQCLIIGSYADLQGDLGVTVGVACPKSAKFSDDIVNRRIAFSPEMAAHLGAPLDSLRLVGTIPDAGTGGLTFPSCTYCPQATFTNEAAVAKYQGTVQLLVVVTPEGRATDIQVVQGLKYGLEQSAVSTVAQWRFAPARDPDGNPVSVRQPIEVAFHLEP